MVISSCPLVLGACAGELDHPADEYENAPANIRGSTGVTTSGNTAGGTTAGSTETSGSTAGTTTGGATGGTGGFTVPSCFLQNVTAAACSLVGCHGNVPMDGIDLTNPQRDALSWVGHPASGYKCGPDGTTPTDLPWINPDPTMYQQSLLWNKLSSATPVCGDPMPAGSTWNGDQAKLDCLTTFLQTAAMAKAGM